MVSEVLFNNIMLLYMFYTCSFIHAQGQGNIINVKKLAFGNKVRIRKWESRFY